MSEQQSSPRTNSKNHLEPKSLEANLSGKSANPERPVPTSILKKSSTEMEIRWDNGLESVLSFLDLRVSCQCAQCVDEWTREQRVSRKNIKPDIKPLKLEPVGLYAVQINWSDGHNSSIYSFDQLFNLVTQTRD